MFSASYHICELPHAIFSFITYSICRQSVYIELLFMCISHLSRLWKKSGVKTRSSEQAMVPVEAYISMVTGSSSEEDSETDDQSYIPPEVYALSFNVYISHIMHMVSCIA